VKFRFVLHCSNKLNIFQEDFMFLQLQKGLFVMTLSVAFIFPLSGNASDKAGVPEKSKKDSAIVQSKKPVVPAKTILFFMNPNGHPCQMQNAVLEGIKDSLAGKATIKYIKTTEESDRDAFDTYGIRGLPSLIIVDKNGKELKRFSPGIQDKDAILDAVRK
jgi:thiol-disulfide isomerase/thioredoxin